MVKRVRDDWLDVARATFVRAGVNAVSIQGLARSLRVTRGSFYGYFRSRSDLLGRLLEDWRTLNTRALRRIAGPGRRDGFTQFRELVEMWLDDADYSPQFDSAVRDWARSSPAVARAVHAVDLERIRLITRIFRNLGFSGPQAQIRARITYFHQVGYYTLAIRESRSVRRRLSPLYSLVLAGSRAAQGLAEHVTVE